MMEEDTDSAPPAKVTPKAEPKPEPPAPVAAPAPKEPPAPKEIPAPTPEPVAPPRREVPQIPSAPATKPKGRGIMSMAAKVIDEEPSDEPAGGSMDELARSSVKKAVKKGMAEAPSPAEYDPKAYLLTMQGHLAGAKAQKFMDEDTEKAKMQDPVYRVSQKLRDRWEEKYLDQLEKQMGGGGAPWYSNPDTIKNTLGPIVATLMQPVNKMIDLNKSRQINFNSEEIQKLVGEAQQANMVIQQLNDRIARLKAVNQPTVKEEDLLMQAQVLKATADRDLNVAKAEVIDQTNRQLIASQEEDLSEPLDETAGTEEETADTKVPKRRGRKKKTQTEGE